MTQVTDAAIADTGYSKLSQEGRAQASAAGQAALVEGAKTIVRIALDRPESRELIGQAIEIMTGVLVGPDLSEPESAAAMVIAVTGAVVESLAVNHLSPEETTAAAKDAAQEAQEMVTPMIVLRKQFGA